MASPPTHSPPRKLIQLYGEDLIKRLNEKRVGADIYPMVKNFPRWAQPDVVIDQIASGKPYPIKGAWIQDLQHHRRPGGARGLFTWRRCRKLDSWWWSICSTTRPPLALADIILPAATFPEKDSIRSWWVPLTSMKKCVQVGECKSDWEINFEMAKRF